MSERFPTVPEPAFEAPDSFWPGAVRNPDGTLTVGEGGEIIAFNPSDGSDYPVYDSQDGGYVLAPNVHGRVFE